MKNIKQQGMATLITTVVLLIAISLMSLYTSQVGVVEQKISSNHYRAQQAFEVAEAGLNNAIDYFDMALIKASVCVGEDIDVMGLCKGLNAATGIGTEADFSGDRELISLSRFDDGAFKLEFKANSNNPNMVDLKLEGYAPDAVNPNRVITQNLMMTPILNYHPPATLIAREKITLGFESTISNKVMGSLSSSWSGNETSMADVSIIDVTSADGLKVGGFYPQDAALAALSLGDVSAVPALPNVFFENFFSKSFVDLKERSAVLDCETGCNENDLNAFVDAAGNPVSNNIVWVDANNAGVFDELSLGGIVDFGTIENPFLLIVDGDLILNTPAINFFGLIYITGNVYSTIGGSIMGGVISEKSIESTGPLSVVYSDEVFNNMDADMAFFTRVSGSWKDF